MKVRDLVAGSIFTPGAGYTAEPAPRVSVILPTFRRGDSDMLRRAIDSVLSQSLRELELIIVDDGSTESTASVIADAMANDPRVSVIRHPRNIGLPAVSEYEGYVRARGDRIAFAFDDTVFYPGSLEALLAQSDAHPDAAIAGYFEMFYRTTPDGPLYSTPLGLDADLANLLWRNVIPNGAVMLPRQIIEVVGLYDPHISLARLCDYDLWLRVRRRFPIRTVNVCVGEEHGPATVDSLGSTYPLDSWLADDRMRQERDALLLPEHFGDVDVTSWEVFTSERSIANCVRIASAHAAARGWEQPDPPQFSVDDPVARVAIVAPNVDASVQTMFHGMRDVPDVHIRYLDHARESVTTLAHADAVIVSRRAEGLVRWALAAREAGLSAIFHIDDHFPLMFQSGELDPRCAADFSEDALREALKAYDGVIAPSAALASSLRDIAVHDSVAVIPLTVPSSHIDQPTTHVSTATRPPTFALFTGYHRDAHAIQVVLPALQAAAQKEDVTLRVLVPRGHLAAAPLSSWSRLEVEFFTPNSDYFAALVELRARGVDALVVPHTDTVNAAY